MIIPYRTGRILRRILWIILVLALVAGAILLCWFLWLRRYVVYTRDGAILDFNISLQYSSGETAVQPDTVPTVEIHYGEDTVPEQNQSKELQQFAGYFVTLTELTEDFAAVEEKLDALPAGSTVMIDMKDVRSYFYYSTSLGYPATKIDVTQMDALISRLKAKGHYLIARIPTLQEYDYILDNQAERVPYGLPRKGGNGSLWLDTEGPCYWLNPTKDGTVTYLIQIMTELRVMGFQEVVFADFRFPKTDKIDFEGDQIAALNQLADTLIKTCATEDFCVSFTREAADLTLPDGRTRLYLTGISAADAAVQAGQTGFTDKSVHVVFITDAGDTRYEQFSVLRPIDTAR